jgi:hypothetical protein
MVVGADCDDTSAAVSPDDGEIPCTMRDEDCDGASDEGPRITYYPDRDMDSFGDGTATPIEACTRPAGYVDNDDDCADGNASLNPAAGELCNLADDNCNGTIDEGFATSTYYPDADGDGWPVDGAPVSACVMPTGYAPPRGTRWDCNDADATVYPTATERCNGVDDDCTGFAEYAIAGSGSEDDDRDGHADRACPGGGGDDCDDTRADVYGGALELCDAIDNDCDGARDEGSEPVSTCAAAPHVVAASATCTAGAVCSATCESGWGDCDGDLSYRNGCESDLGSDSECGACGYACGAAMDCMARRCELVAGPQRISAWEISRYPSIHTDASTCVVRGG